MNMIPDTLHTRHVIFAKRPLFHRRHILQDILTLVVFNVKFFGKLIHIKLS